MSKTSSLLAATEQLRMSWPAHMALSADPAVAMATNPLAAEFAALADGRAASLPQWRPEGIVWRTCAADVQQLQVAVEGLHAWLIPSFAWEEPDLAWRVNTSSDPLDQALFAVGCRAIYRWRSHARDTERVLKKLAQARRLASQRPLEDVHRLPSRHELRRQIAMALAVGDRDAAEVALGSLDQQGLETAQNLSWLRVRELDRFGATHELVELAGLAESLRPPVPHAVVHAAVRACHAVYLAPHEMQGDLPASIAAFADQVQPKLRHVLRWLQPTDGVEALRVLAYRARNSGVTHEEIAGSDDPWVRRLLQAVPVVAMAPRVSPVAPPTGDTAEEQLLLAASQRNWPLVQELGAGLLSTAPDFVRPLLIRSLAAAPNPALERALRGTQEQTWRDWLRFIQECEWARAEAFLTSNHDARAKFTPDQLDDIASVLLSIYQDPALLGNEQAWRRFEAGLPEFVADVIQDPDYPRRDLAHLYLPLLYLWGHRFCGVLDPLYANVLLALADGLVRYSSDVESEVAGVFKAWWDRRRVRAALPFLLDALDFLATKTHQSETCATLWLEAGTLLARDLQSVGAADRQLWREMGVDLGLEQENIDALVPALPPATTEETDPLAALHLQRVAIVWRDDGPARLAAARIEQRSGASVVLVTEEHPRGQTERALTADVVLLVWRNTSHAVSRAFQRIDRKRLVYVPSAGASGVQRSLERWALDQPRGRGQRLVGRS